MAREKEAVSKNRPCIFCHHSDWCFRLINEDATTSHFCARTDYEGVVSIGGTEYARTGTSHTAIGTYAVYMDCKEHKRQQREWAIAHSQTSSIRSKPSALDRTNGQPQTIVPETGTPKKAEPVRSAEEIDTFFRFFLSLLKLEEKHRVSLLQEWHGQVALETLIDYWQIRSLPPADYQRFQGKEQFINPSRKSVITKLQQQFGSDLHGFPGFYQKDNGMWDFPSSREGIAFPTYNTEGLMTGLRVKVEYPEISGVYLGKEGTFSHRYCQGQHQWYFLEKPQPGVTPPAEVLTEFHSTPQGKVNGKYKPFSSPPEFYRNGTSSGALYSLYMRPDDNMKVLYITEGEKKGMVSNALLHAPVISLPGVGTFRQLFEKHNGVSVLDILHAMGIELVVICYDADKASNMQVLASEQEAVKSLLMEGMRLAVGEWNAAFGKGMDDILIQGVFPTLYSVA